MNLTEWKDRNPIPDGMLWKGGAEKQIENFWSLAESFGVQVLVVREHTSKSINLPVVELLFPNKGRILLRDNFYNVEIAVLWNRAPKLEYSDVYQPVSEWNNDTKQKEEVDGWEWYLSQIKRCEEYSWRGWSPEELADQRITRVEVTRPDGAKYWNETTPAKKDMWNKRMTDPEWHHKDWSSGALFYDGKFGPGAKLYVGYHTSLEGISSNIPWYAREIFKKGKKEFTVSSDWDRVRGIIERINAAEVA